MRNLVFFGVFFVSLGIATAQSAPGKPAEPTAIGVAFRLDPTSQELRRLPNEDWKPAGPSMGNNLIYAVVPGSKSAFRLKAGEKVEFVFNTGKPESVSLYRFEQKKDKRRFGYGRVGVVRDDSIKGLHVNLSKYGESSYKLAPVSALNPGEYAIVIADEVFTFGIDQ